MVLPRYILPKDLSGALRQLENGELARLLTALLAETKRRDTGTSDHADGSRPAPGIVSPPRGQINAVRAASKAGLTPSRIARQFGIALADVRKILAVE